jgi:hypothetical protein
MDHKLEMCCIDECGFYNLSNGLTCFAFLLLMLFCPGLGCGILHKEEEPSS